MENKFELLEDFQTYKPTPLHSREETELTTFSLVVDSSMSTDHEEVSQQPTVTVSHSCSKQWGPKEYQTSNHPLKLMVRKHYASMCNRGIRVDNYILTI